MRDLLKKVLFFLKQRVGAEMLRHSTESFMGLERKESFGNVLFIDGGNAELCRSSDFAVHFVRLCGVSFGKKKTIDRREGFVLADVNGSCIDIRFFGLDMHDRLSFCAEDFQDVGCAALTARKIAEIEFARKLLKHADLIVLDGSLRSKNRYEQAYLNALIVDAQNLGKVVCGLSKTTSDAEKGKIIQGLIKRDGCWIYRCNDVFFVKLNKKSRYVFQLDVEKEHAKMVAEELVNLSNDASFLGYPYGLIIAHRFAKVEESEKDYLTALFEARAGKEWEWIRDKLKAVDAHDNLA